MKTFAIPVGSGSYASDALLPVGTTQPPSELLNFIEKQESYIEQLEKESNFCRVSFLRLRFVRAINQVAVSTGRTFHSLDEGQRCRV